MYHIYIYIYIYRERERESEIGREAYMCIYLCLCVCVSLSLCILCIHVHRHIHTHTWRCIHLYARCVFVGGPGCSTSQELVCAWPVLAAQDYYGHLAERKRMTMPIPAGHGFNKCRAIGVHGEGWETPPV